MTSNEWMNDPSVKHIPKEKLDFLHKLAFESQNLSQKEKLPFFMALAGRAKQENITFSESEIAIIVAALKSYSTPNEIAKMDQILKIYREKK